MKDDKASLVVATDSAVKCRFIDTFSSDSYDSWAGWEGYWKLWVLFEDAFDSLAKLVGVFSLQIEVYLGVEIPVEGDSVPKTVLHASENESLGLLRRLQWRGGNHFGCQCR